MKSIAALRAVGCAVVVATGAYAQTAYLAPLTPQQEVPPTSATGNGLGLGILTGSSFQSIIYHSEPTANNAHIHNAPVGTSGGVVVGFSAPYTSPINSTNTLSATVLGNLNAGTLYYNIHTPAFSGGAIRGQLLAGSGGPSRLFITEAFPDPTGLDVNLDGIPATAADQKADEFVEIVNATGTTVSLAGWTLSDNSGVRHVFTAGTSLGPVQALVVFGGGSVAALTGAGFAATTASSGTLGLDNVGDAVTLRDPFGAVVDVFSYGATTPGTSLVRSPMAATAPLVNHSTLGSPSGAGLTTTTAVRFPAGTVGAAAPVPTYPGNGTDAAIQVRINGTTDAAPTNVHVAIGGDLITLEFVTPGALIEGTPFIALIQSFATGAPPSPLTLPGDPAGAVWASPALPTVILVDSISAPGFFFTPALGPYSITGALPVGLSGAGLSLMATLLPADPGRNLVNLGSADAHEIVVN